ncbi:long-chain-fatty-acid--CoA ligase [Streptomyces sp. BE230]|uniref:long-chain-fatty-acid--CoA ligase n=1 Tax=Streptomyces sp. BE230 TaxID=3002526 RepID=UPI002ED5D43D|nr:long-chain-fatty-acid--CoA ligase [Streptomyces sp. BE230]
MTTPTTPDIEAQQHLDAARRLSLGAQLTRFAGRHPDRLAFRFEGRELTYAELDGRVSRLARALRARGTGRGDRVAVVMNNALEVLESYFAVVRLGAVAVPVNFRLVAEEIAYVLADSGTSAVLTDAALAPVVTEALARNGRALPVLSTGEGERPEGVASYEAALAEQPDAPLIVDVHENEPAFIMYTSGTTGRPKGAVLTHLNLVANTLNSHEVQPILAGERGLACVPLFHIAGLSTCVNHFLAGASVVIGATGGFGAGEMLDLLERERINGCFFVPSQWAAICAHPGVRERRLHLTRISWGAAAATPTLLRDMADTFPGVRIISTFGQTEMSPVTCALGHEDALRKLGSVGRPVSRVDIRIVDEEMRDVEPGEVGEIVYRGPTMMREYWNRPDATAEAFEGGWFHSGDLCRMDDEGFVYVVDRKKDMIISGGENIYSAEVEAAVDAHPGVAEVAVIGVPHEKWGETPRAYVVAHDAANPPTEREIIEHCRERLASYKKPSSVVIVATLPRNASGKVIKGALRGPQ